MLFLVLQFFCIRVFVAILNQITAVLAMIAFALYSWDLMSKRGHSTALITESKSVIKIKYLYMKSI